MDGHQTALSIIDHSVEPWVEASVEMGKKIYSTSTQNRNHFQIHAICAIQEHIRGKKHIKEEKSDDSTCWGYIKLVHNSSFKTRLMVPSADRGDSITRRWKTIGTGEERVGTLEEDEKNRSSLWGKNGKWHGYIHLTQQRPWTQAWAGMAMHVQNL